MKKSIIALILAFFAVFCAFGQNSDTIDLVLLLDTSSSMGSSYEKVNNYITGQFLSDFLRTGDTFHLISFSSSPRLDIARKITSIGDVETIIGRMLIQYPVETGNNVTAAVNYAEAYIATLPPRPKKIIVVSAAGPETSGIINSAKQRFSSKNATFDFVSVTEVIPGSPNLSNPPGSGRSSPRQTSSQQSAPSGTASTAGTGSTKPDGTASTQGTSGTQASQGSSTQGTAQGTSAQGTSAQGTSSQGTSTQGTSQTGTQGGTQSGTAQGTSETGTQSGAKSGTAQEATGTGASQTGGQTAQGAGAQSTPNAQSATPGAQTAQPPSGDSPGTGSSARGASSQDGKQASDKNRDSGQDAAAKGSTNGGSSSASGQKGSRSINPTLLIIIGVVAAVLLLILLIAFISRRLGSSPNRVMASVSASGGKDEKFTDHSRDLASYAARQSKQRVTPYQGRPVKQQNAAQNTINPSGPLLLNLFVDDQSTSIGKRNIHSLKSGYSLSVGGGASDDFHIFLVSMPPHLGDIRRNGSQLTFIPRKPKYFPDLGSNEVKDCINKRIRVVSDKNYEMWFSFVTYEDPLEALNRVLHSIKVPG